MALEDGTSLRSFCLKIVSTASLSVTGHEDVLAHLDVALPLSLLPLAALPSHPPHFFIPLLPLAPSSYSAHLFQLFISFRGQLQVPRDLFCSTGLEGSER